MQKTNTSDKAQLHDFQAWLKDYFESPELALVFRAKTTDGSLEPVLSGCVFDGAVQTAQLTMNYPVGIEEEIFVKWDGQNSVWQRRVRNGSNKPVHLVEMSMIVSGLTFGADHARDYFYHPENPRIYERFTIPVRAKRTSEMVKDSGFDSVAGNKWADPGVVSDRIGASPYQPFPALLVSNYKVDRGIVHGSLSQRVFYHNHLLRHEDGAIVWEMLSSFKSVSHRELLPGETIDSDRWYIGHAKTTEFTAIFGNYTAELRKHLPAMWGARGINRHTAVWGSWNDGILWNIDEKRLLEVADFLRENLPTVEWMQVDDGYSTGERPDGLGMPYCGEAGIDKTKFPHGLKHYTDEVKARGIKPAIWIGGYVPEKGRIAQERPELFIDYSYRMQHKPFDVSKPAAREYMTSALDVLLRDYGFEGMKHDFWSYAFEDSHALLANHDKSGYEWRSWWLREIRKRLPDYGYLQTGCDIVMGNPFLGEYFTNYRYGIDVGDGDWNNVRTNSLWGVACFGAQTGDLIVPNSDAIGIFKKLPDDEALSLINYCLISRSLVEVGGWLHQNAGHPRMRWVRKALSCPNNGENVFFGKFDFRKQDAPPAVWYLKSPHFSLLRDNLLLPMRTAAVFNMTDEKRIFALKANEIGLRRGKYVATDVWSLETVPIGALGSIELPPHASRLFTISPVVRVPQILDADFEVLSASYSKGSMTIGLGRGRMLEMALSAKPSEVAFSVPSENLTIREGRGNWLVSARVSGPCEMTVKFA